MPYCAAQRDTDNALVGDRTGLAMQDISCAGHSLWGRWEGDLVGTERPGDGVRCQTDFLCPEVAAKERLPAGTGKRCLADVCEECNGARPPSTCDVCGDVG
jgi:hypothetical protein